MSLREIASIAGVSVSTVSRVINDKHRDKVSEDTRQRIMEIARSLRYRPNPEAVALKTRRRATTLGLLIPYHSHIFRGFYWSEISCGVLDGANARGVDVSMLVHQDDSDETFREILSSHRSVAGIIVLEVHRQSNPAIEHCRNAMIPFVVVNNSGAEPNADSVECDNRNGGYQATRHLVGMGHTRIAHIAGRDSPDAHERTEGYREALAEAGLSVDESLTVPGGYQEAGGRTAMRALLSRSPRPTAVFAANDQSAIGAMTVIKAAGLRIPDDIAVVGFDDIPLAQYVQPALTTVHQPIYRIGFRAAQMLIDRIRTDANIPTAESPAAKGVVHSVAAPVAHQVVRTRLVVRESCGARRRNEG